jgi:hypothetical protein
MGQSDKQRVIDLQKQLRTARLALEKIGHGHSQYPEADALQALDDMLPRDKTVPLDGILGWAKRA